MRYRVTVEKTDDDGCSLEYRCEVLGNDVLIDSREPGFGPKTMSPARWVAWLAERLATNIEATQAMKRDVQIMVESLNEQAAAEAKARLEKGNY